MNRLQPLFKTLSLLVLLFFFGGQVAEANTVPVKNSEPIIEATPASNGNSDGTITVSINKTENDEYSLFNDGYVVELYQAGNLIASENLLEPISIGQVSYTFDELAAAVVRFVVNKEGKVTSPEIIKPVSPDIDAEVLRIMNLMPDWNPWEQEGKRVSTYFNLPVKFKITFIQKGFHFYK